MKDKELQNLYPNGGFKIYADTYIYNRHSSENSLVGRSSELSLCAYRKKQPWFKRTIGYIPVTAENGEDGFIRILGIAWHRPFMVILAFLIAVSIFLIGILYAQKDDVPGLDKTAVSYHIEGVKNTDSDSILLPGLNVLNGKANDTRIRAALINPEGNSCYFKYKITLTETGENLYTSGLIEPGKAIMKFNLNRPLPSGKYPIKVLVETRDLKDQDITYNAGNIEAQLVISK